MSLSDPSHYPSYSMKPPMCPDCGIPMRFESGSPDERHDNLRHITFTCDCCGKTVEQLIRDAD